MDTNSNSSNSTPVIIENKLFAKEYNCFPLSYLCAQEIKTKAEIKILEKSDRIIMPPSALRHLMEFKIEY